ncbi:hypothetical protein [Streptomyces sp. NBC_00005]|uniref:hypothetical protein n=1 Tax=Streptomyces sp. NBC_00005 TaxID=2903609 RepID=UPI0032456C78
MITHSDEGPEYDPDDPLTVILRPPAEYLGAPPGRYEAIRRGATRRRVLRAAAGAALTCGVAALVVLPLRLTGSDGPASPAVPMAPPPASSPSAPEPTPTRTPSMTAPEPATPTPAQGTRTTDPSRSSLPTRAPSALPSTSASTSTRTSAPSVAPSASPTVGATDARG